MIPRNFNEKIKKANRKPGSVIYLPKKVYKCLSFI